MGLSDFANVHLELGYQWLPEFSKRQVLFRPTHNTWFCGVPGRIGKGDIPNETEELLALFLKEETDWNANLRYQSVAIRRICEQAILSTLKAGNDESITRRCMALLDERTENETQDGMSSGLCRRKFNDETFNAHDLFKALRQKVRSFIH